MHVRVRRVVLYLDMFRVNGCQYSERSQLLYCFKIFFNSDSLFSNYSQYVNFFDFLLLCASVLRVGLWAMLHCCLI